MGRRKKRDYDSEKDSEGLVINGDAKRGVVAIFLFALAVLFVLGFLSDAKIVDAGILGKFLNKAAGCMFGVGKYVSPIVLAGAGIILLFRKETLFYVSKLIGICAAFFSMLGLVHIFLYDPDKMLKAARAGEGGGFVGYVISYLLTNLTGKAGATVVIVAIFLIGFIIAFNFSLVSLVEKFIRKEIKELKEEDDEKEGKDNEEGMEEMEKEPIEDPVVIDEKNKQDGEVEYVKGPDDDSDDELSEKVLKKAAAWTPENFSAPGKKNHEYNTDWRFPSIDLLETRTEKAQGGDVNENVRKIRDTLKHFGIDVKLGEIKTGPTVTQYSFRPAVGVKLTRITSLSNDLALALAAHPIRIEAPIPGKSRVGIEVPNKIPATVRLHELLQSQEFANKQSNLLLALGKDVSGSCVFGDLKKMPHLLIAGSTNSGKSVCINTILMSLLYQNSPEDLKLILVDPKRVELSLYDGIPHLLADTIVDNGKVLNALKWAIREMEERYKLLQSVGSRDITSFNHKAENGETRRWVDPETNEKREEIMEKIPYIVIVIDELADLMTSSHGKEVEGAIIRLAQMSRAVGIHLILSTQKPTVTVITSLIKSNIPTRIAFKVPALMDSRTILDASGAEKLLGNGDMLFSSAAAQGLRRLQGVYVSESEVKHVVSFIKKQGKDKIEEGLSDDIVGSENDRSDGKEKHGSMEGRIDFDSIVNEGDDREDQLYEEAKNIVTQARKASTSLLQRRLRVGYSRAARLMDALEERGVIGPQDGSKPREVLIGSEQPNYEDHVEDQIQRDKWQM